MRTLTRSLCRAGLIGGAALALTCLPMYAGAQQGTTQTAPSTQTEGTRQNPNPDLTNAELASMDQFLDDHKGVDKDLRVNPSLVNNQKYLSRHKELQSFLNAHPQIRDQFTENPSFFMNRENQLEGTNRDVDRRDRDRNVTDRDQNRNQNVTDRDQNRDRNFTDRNQNPNPDLRNWELARMDQFLDDHQQIDQQLTANPSLINSQSYLAQHQDLKLFLSQHPQVREEFAENPTNFMNQEKRFETQENLRSRTGQSVGQTNRNTGPDRDQNPNPDLRNWELARMDQFLDDHQQIDKELAANPSLVNNQNYLAQHQDLKLFLNDHPQVREEFAENPTYFMNQEKRFDTQEELRSRTGQNVGQTNGNTNPDRDRDVTNQQNAANSNQDRDQDRDRNFTDRDQDRDRDANRQNAQNGTAANNNQDRDQDRDRTFTDRDQDRNQNPNPDLRNWELARMDQFLDDHQQIDKSLTAKPSLINDQKYLAQHKDLQMFLNEHPQVREEFAENPSYFMNRENRFDSREFAGRTDVDRNSSRSNSNLSDKQAKRMDQFLDKHKDIDRDLAKNPSLCNDDKYLNHHKDLRAFLDKNPEVRTQVASNSAYFTQRHERMQGHTPVKGTKPPAKTPIEQHETTTPAAATH